MKKGNIIIIRVNIGSTGYIYGNVGKKYNDKANAIYPQFPVIAGACSF